MVAEKLKLVSVSDFEAYAYRKLPPLALDYYRSGAVHQKTLQLNKEMFQKLRIRPRVLVDATKLDTCTTVLGHKLEIPLGIAPSAMQKMAHPDGEIGNARAIGSFGGIYILSTLSTTSLENVAKGAPDTIKWFQLYVYKDRELTKSVVQRAEKAGFKALVLTVDANVFGVRYADKKNSFQLPSHLRLANFDGVLAKMDKSEGDSGLAVYSELIFDQSINWKDVDWLKSITKLPIILKGILTEEDARKAVDHGVAAVIVSNHGGRQLDTSPSSIEALPEIVKAVGNKIEVYLDGGVELGTDILKALALGAKMVFIGRPALWGLAYDGEKGVKAVLDILNEEFRVALALTGCQKIADIDRNMVVHESYYHKL